MNRKKISEITLSSSKQTGIKAQLPPPLCFQIGGLNLKKKENFSNLKNLENVQKSHPGSKNLQGFDAEKFQGDEKRSPVSNKCNGERRFCWNLRSCPQWGPPFAGWYGAFGSFTRETRAVLCFGFLCWQPNPKGTFKGLGFVCIP